MIHSYRWMLNIKVNIKEWLIKTESYSLVLRYNLALLYYHKMLCIAFQLKGPLPPASTDPLYVHQITRFDLRCSCP